jgi:glycosyltransferase involved in cell wall biosynthesis
VRIAIVHPYPVWSRSVGGTTRVYALVRHLAPRHEVHVFAHSEGNPEEEGEAIRELALLGVEQKVIAREPKSFFKKATWVAGKTPYVVNYNRNPELEAALAALDRERGIDVAHIECSALTPLLRGLGPACVRVLAEQELMSIVAERLRSVASRHKSPFQHYAPLELPRLRTFEATVLPCFDRLFAINESEAARMAKCSGRTVEVLPHVVDTRTFVPGDGASPRPSVLFVGNYGHHPNVEASFWLMEKVWPLVRSAVPEAAVRLVGPGFRPEQRKALEELGAEVPGRVEDIVGTYRAATVFANPILSGGGMRGKVLEAMACGLPVVSTPRGLEGVAATTGQHCEGAARPELFSAAIVRLLGDPSTRESLARRARALVETRYDVRLVMGRLEAAFEEAHASQAAGRAAP